MKDPRPTGLLVFYDEAKGVRSPEVKLFAPSARIEQQVNTWIREKDGITVHRIEWLPSGGLLGANVVYSTGGNATDALRVVLPGLEPAEKRLKQRAPLEGFAQFSLYAGVALALVGMLLFYLFYPETWYGYEGALTDPQTAVEWTVLTAGLGIMFLFAGVTALVRARLA